MDFLSDANKAALMQRFGAVFPGASFPKTLSEMPLTAQLQWKSIDPEAAAIAEGNISAEHQAWLMSNTLDTEVPAQVDPEAEKQAYFEESMKRMEQQLELQRQANAEQKQASEAMRQASVDQMHRSFRDQSAALRGR